MIREMHALFAVVRGETRPIRLFKGEKTSFRPPETVVRPRDARRAQVAKHRAGRSKTFATNLFRSVMHPKARGKA